MLVLGVVLVLTAVVVTVAVLQTGDDPVRVHALWFSVHTNGLGVFLSGAVSVLLVVLGFWVLWIGLRRSRKRHREMKELRRRAFEATPPATSTAAAGSERQPGPSRPPDPQRRPPDADDYFDTTPRD